MNNTNHQQTALADTDTEIARQDKKWGEQNHPDGTGPNAWPLTGIQDLSPYFHATNRLGPADDLATSATRSTDAAAQAGTVTWSDILLEEVFEALAEHDPDRLRTELIQVAAVATQWAAAIDRRRAVQKTALAEGGDAS